MSYKKAFFFLLSILTIIVAFLLGRGDIQAEEVSLSLNIMLTTEEYLTVKYDDPLFNKIAQCESEFNPVVENKICCAGGVFQITNRSWEYYGPMLWGDDFLTKKKLSAVDNIELARFMYERNGTRDWNESKHCWS